MEKDELGIEVDEDVVQALKDPKGGLLLKVIDYHGKRKLREAELQAIEEAKKPKPESKLFGIF